MTSVTARRFLLLFMSMAGIEPPSPERQPRVLPSLHTCLWNWNPPFSSINSVHTSTCSYHLLPATISISLLRHFLIMLVVLPRCVKGPAGPRSRLASHAAVSSCRQSVLLGCHDNQQTIPIPLFSYYLIGCTALVFVASSRCKQW